MTRPIATTRSAVGCCQASADVELLGQNYAPDRRDPTSLLAATDEGVHVDIIGADRQSDDRWFDKSKNGRRATIHAPRSVSWF
jgi:hypothetical protein